MTFDEDSQGMRHRAERIVRTYRQQNSMEADYNSVVQWIDDSIERVFGQRIDGNQYDDTMFMAAAKFLIKPKLTSCGVTLQSTKTDIAGLGIPDGHISGLHMLSAAYHYLYATSCEALTIDGLREQYNALNEAESEAAKAVYSADGTEFPGVNASEDAGVYTGVDAGEDTGEAALRAIIDELTESQIDTMIEDGLQFIQLSDQEEADDLLVFMATEYPGCDEQEDMDLASADCTIYDKWERIDNAMLNNDMEWDDLITFIEDEAEERGIELGDGNEATGYCS